MNRSESEREINERDVLTVGGKCFPLSLFANKEEMSDFICPINFGVLNDPVTDNCGHTFCRFCLNEYLKNSLNCPYTNNKIVKSELNQAISLQQSIQEKSVYCCHNKCPWKGKLEELIQHINESCEFKYIQCKEVNCLEIFMRCDSASHNKTCKFKSISCDFCQAQLLMSEYLIHLENCSKNKSKCNLCNSPILASQIQDHFVSNCPESIIPCMYAEYGCLEKVRRKDFENHFRKSIFKHFNLMKTSFEIKKAELMGENRVWREALEQAKKEAKELILSKMHDQERELFNIRGEQLQNSHAIERMKKENIILNENIIGFQNEITNETSRLFGRIYEITGTKPKSSIFSSKSELRRNEELVMMSATSRTQRQLSSANLHRKEKRSKSPVNTTFTNSNRKILEKKDLKMKPTSFLDFFGPKDKVVLSDIDFDKAKPKKILPVVCHADVVEDIIILEPLSKIQNIATCSGDKTIKIWLLNQNSSCNLVKVLEGHKGCVGKLLYVSSKRYLISAGTDSEIKIWDSETWSCIKSINAHSESVQGLTYFYDNKNFASCSVDKTVKVWDLDAFYLRTQMIFTEVLTEISYVNVENLGGNALLLVGDAKGNLYFNKVGSKNDSMVLEKKKVRKAHEDAVFKIIFINSTRMVASSSFGDDKIIIWNPVLMDPIKQIIIFKKGSTSMFYDIVYDILFLQGNMDENCMIKILRVDSFEVVRVFKEQYSFKNILWVAEKNVMISCGGTIGIQGKMNLIFF